MLHDASLPWFLLVACRWALWVRGRDDVSVCLGGVVVSGVRVVVRGEWGARAVRRDESTEPAHAALTSHFDEARVG
jgi:hypothetical protein